LVVAVAATESIRAVAGFNRERAAEFNSKPLGASTPGGFVWVMNDRQRPRGARRDMAFGR
jgi:hypothetical protein